MRNFICAELGCPLTADKAQKGGLLSVSTWPNCGNRLLHCLIGTMRLRGTREPPVRWVRLGAQLSPKLGHEREACLWMSRTRTPRWMLRLLVFAQFMPFKALIANIIRYNMPYIQNFIRYYLHLCIDMCVRVWVSVCVCGYLGTAHTKMRCTLLLRIDSVYLCHSFYK